MTAAELRYMIALHALQKEGACVRGSDLASKMGVSKVSAYRMCERLKSHALLLGSGEGSLGADRAGRGIARRVRAMHRLCARKIRRALPHAQKHCRARGGRPHLRGGGGQPRRPRRLSAGACRPQTNEYRPQANEYRRRVGEYRLRARASAFKSQIKAGRARTRAGRARTSAF